MWKIKFIFAFGRFTFAGRIQDNPRIPLPYRETPTMAAIGTVIALSSNPIPSNLDLICVIP